MRAKVSFVLLSAISSTVLSDSLSVPPKLTAHSHDHVLGSFFIANLILSTSTEFPTHSNSISSLHSHSPIPYRTAVIHWGWYIAFHRTVFWYVMELLLISTMRS
jgi:hypothetical protein